MSKLQKGFVQSILAQTERSYFPSILLAVELEGEEGEDRDWSIYQIGVANAAEMAFDLLAPRLDAALKAMGESYQHLELALELSDDMELSAVEPLLAARNVLATRIAAEWARFYEANTALVSSILGLRMEHITAKESSFDPVAMGATMLLMLTRGRPHPFWAWSLETYVNKRDMNLDNIIGAYNEFCRQPPVQELNKLQATITLSSAVTQYVTWARTIYNDTKRRIETKSAGMAVPTEELASWVASELFGDKED